MSEEQDMSGKQRLRVVRNEAESRFEAYLDDDLAAVLTYVSTPEGLDLQHTVVERAHRGKGIGEEFAEAVFDELRETGERVIPTCPFLSRYIAEHPEHQALVAA